MNIGKLLKLYRHVNEIEFRKFAKEVGVSPATLCRIESGKKCSMDVSLKLLLWLFK